MKLKKLILAVIIIIFISGVLLLRKNRKSDTGYAIENPHYGSIKQSVSANGMVKPRNRLEIKPPFAGRVESILVGEGEKVRKGEILAWMSSLDRAALLDAARAKGEEEKWEDAYKPTPIVAPLSGFIIRRGIEPGQTVSAQDPILVMADNLIVKADVDETDIGKLKPGQKVRIVLDAYPDMRIHGSIEHIAYESQVINNVTIYRVDILPDKAFEILRSGMSVDVEITVTNKKNILLLSLNAVKEKKDMKYVLLETRHAEPERREITTGIDDGRNVEIVSGLEESDSVIIRPERKREPHERRPRGLPGMRRR